jgi:ketosteroid isomerase-like protein
MRRHRLTLLTLLSSLGCAAASTSSGASSRVDPAAEHALRERSDAFQSTESTLNAPKAAAFWAADAVVQPAGAPAIVGRPAIEGLYRQFFTTMGVKELKGTTTHLELARSGDLAYETGNNRIVVRTPTGDLLDIGKYLLVWKKVDGQWYVAALSFASDAAAPTPIAAK